jgi:purine-binding chemotaxis protein CheW
MEFSMAEENESSQKFLAFYLNKKNYAFQILKVNEVIQLPDITPMPKTPEYMKGVMNLRGQIIPIIDLRLALNMDKTEYNKQTCVIIVKMQIQNLFIVDSVSEVFEIEVSNIEPPPNYGEQHDNEFLNGIGKVKNQIVMLLDIDKILSGNDADTFMLSDLESMAE